MSNQLQAKTFTIKSLVQMIPGTSRQAGLDHLLTPFYTALANVSGSAKSPARRYAAFKRDVLPRLTTTLAKPRLSEAGRIAVSHAAARVLRTISVDAWTKAKDAKTASAALKHAMQYAVDDVLRGLYEDFKILNDILFEQGAAERKRPITDAMWRAGTLILSTLSMVVTLYLSRAPHDWGIASLAIPSSRGVIRVTTQQSVAGSNASASATGRADHHRAANELNEKQRVIAEQQLIAEQLAAEYRDAASVLHQQESEANNLEQQLHEQSRQIAREMHMLNTSDLSGVEELHSKEDYYNSLGNQARIARNTANALVDPLNALGQRVSGQNALVNGLVDDYNAKTQRIDR
jgi:hypothetical protein